MVELFLILLLFVGCKTPNVVPLLENEFIFDYRPNGYMPLIVLYTELDSDKKVKLEAPYHALTNGGHISYIELDGDTSTNTPETGYQGSSNVWGSEWDAIVATINDNISIGCFP